VGTTFRVELSLEKAAIQSLQPEVKEDYDLSGIRVLVAEDNPVNLLYLKSMLEKNGCIVVEAMDGAAAVEFCREEDCDIILMDLQMPNMDGITASGIIRNVLNSKIPIIAQSASTVQREIDACYEAGINDYIAKPFTFDALKKKVASALHLQSITKPFIPQQTTEPMKVDLLAQAMDMAGNDKMFALKMIQLFLEELPKELTTISLALADRDLDKMRRAAHKSKSTFGILRIQSLTDICVDLEAFEPKGNDWSEAEKLFVQFNDIGRSLLEQGHKDLQRVNAV